jgi:hypothetical protein
VLHSVQRLGEDVCGHLCCSDEVEGDGLVRHVLPDEVVLDVDVLRPGVVLGVVGKGDAALTVRVDDGGAGHVMTEASEE